MEEPASVLVVDDSHCMRMSFQCLLDETGHRMLSAASVGEALQILEREKPDIIVTDLSLPRIDGLDFPVWLKSSLPYAIVIVLSGKNSQEKVREVIRLGVWDYLEKPIQRMEMAEALNGARVPCADGGTQLRKC